MFYNEKAAQNLTQNDYLQPGFYVGNVKLSYNEDNYAYFTVTIEVDGKTYEYRKFVSKPSEDEGKSITRFLLSNLSNVLDENKYSAFVEHFKKVTTKEQFNKLLSRLNINNVGIIIGKKVETHITDGKPVQRVYGFIPTFRFVSKDIKSLEEYYNSNKDKFTYEKSVQPKAEQLYNDVVEDTSDKTPTEEDDDELPF